MSQPENGQQDPMELVTAVRDWAADAREKIAEFTEQAGTPTLAVTAHILNALKRVGEQLDTLGADLVTQLPAEEEAPA